MKKRMKNRNWKDWGKKAGIRAAKTMAEAALGVIGTATFTGEVRWGQVISAAVLAGIITLLVNAKGMPELDEEVKNFKDLED